MPAIYPSALGQHLKALPAVTLLWGEDAGAIRQAAQQAVAATGVDVADPFAATPLTLADIQNDPAALPDAATTVSLMGGKRLVLLKGVSGDEATPAVKALTEAVTTTLQLKLEDVHLILPIPRLLDKAHPLVKAVSTHPQGLSVRFFADTARDLATHLQSLFSAAQKRIDPAALAALTAHLGADRDIATREAEKLILYVAESPTITTEDVQAVVAGATPADVFLLAEAIAARNPARTDRLLQQLLQQGEDLNAAFTMAIRHLQRLHTLQSAPNMAEAVKSLRPPLPPQAQTALLHAAKAYPAKRLKGLNSYMLSTLTTARSGLVSSPHVLSRALLALSA